jgi:hypothetical protein
VAGEEERKNLPGADPLDPQTKRLYKVLVAGSRLLRDPFSNVTRERQKYVLIASTIVLCLRLAVVNIDKVEAEWFDLTVNPQRIVYVLALATIYLTILFAIGAKQELTAAKYAAEAGVLPLRDAVRELLDEAGERGKKIAAIIRRAAVLNKLEGNDPSREQKMKELNAERHRLEDELGREHTRLSEVLSKVQAAVGTEKETLLKQQSQLGDKVARIGEQLDEIDADLRPLLLAEWRRPRLLLRPRSRTEELNKLVAAAILAYQDQTPDKLSELIDRLDFYIFFREYAEFLAPIAYGAIGALAGFWPCFRWLALHMTGHAG